MAEDTYFDGTHRPLAVDGSLTTSSASEANAGSDATKAVAVQGVTGGKAVPPAVATVAAPTYIEGSSDPLSVDLTGGLRVTSTTLATAANQTTMNTNLTRVQGADGATAPSFANLVGGYDGTNLQYLLTDTSGRSRVVGAGATAATAVGDPIGVGGVYVTTPPSVTTGQRSDLQVGSVGSLHVELFTSNSTSAIGSSSWSADALASINGLAVNAMPRLYNGTTFDRQRSSQGAVSSAGVGVLATEEVGRTFSNITTATTTTIKSGAGFLHTLVVNTTVASGVITIYDSTTGSGTKIATITNPITLLQMGPLTATYDLAFSTGLTIVTTGAQDITVTYR